MQSDWVMHKKLRDNRNIKKMVRIRISLYQALSFAFFFIG